MNESNDITVPMETLVTHWKIEVSRVHQELTNRAVEAEIIAETLQARVKDLEEQLAASLPE